MTDRTQYLKNAKERRAYFEGADANRSGELITTNPHLTTGDTVNQDAWDQGWNDANAPAGSQTDYDMSDAGHPVAGKPEPERDAVS